MTNAEIEITLETNSHVRSIFVPLKRKSSSLQDVITVLRPMSLPHTCLKRQKKYYDELRLK